MHDLLSLAGVTINGKDPWDPQIRREEFYDRVLRDGSIALGESYMDGWWDCDRLDEFFHKVLSADLDRAVMKNWKLVFAIAWDAIANPGKRSRSFEVGKRHYDIGNDLYRAMLDPRMVYTCGYWKGAKDLNEAQEAKLDLVCKKIGVRNGQTVLDIGSGWGSFMKYAAERYGARMTGVTVSKKQKELADALCAGLAVETRLADYRDIEGTFDHVVSIGMFEHVGQKNYRTFMKVAHRSLADDGLFLLHTIGNNRSVKRTDPWIAKYIFPNSMIPSLAQIAKAVEGLFVIEDVHNFGAYYDITLMAWHENFEKNWDTLKSHYDERFRRMWRYYLLACAGSFRARKNQLWQIVLSKKGVPGGYSSIR